MRKRLRQYQLKVRSKPEKFFTEGVFGGGRKKKQFRKQDREGKGETDLFGEHGRGGEAKSETIIARASGSCLEIHPDRGQIEKGRQRSRALDDISDRLGLQRMCYEKKRGDQSEEILLFKRHPVFHGRGAKDRPGEVEYDERGEDMDQKIQNVKTPRRETGQINVESEAEVRDKSEGITPPKPSEIQRPKETGFQDVQGVVELKRSGEGVGIGPDPEE